MILMLLCVFLFVCLLFEYSGLIGFDVCSSHIYKAIVYVLHLPSRKVNWHRPGLQLIKVGATTIITPMPMYLLQKRRMGIWLIN